MLRTVGMDYGMYCVMRSTQKNFYTFSMMRAVYFHLAEKGVLRVLSTVLCVYVCVCVCVCVCALPAAAEAAGCGLHPLVTFGAFGLIGIFDQIELHEHKTI